MATELTAPVEYPAGGVTCPSCGHWLFAAAGVDQVRCRCGLTAAGADIREASYLRAGIPRWTQRLAELDAAIGGPGESATSGASGTSRTRADSRVGAHTILVGLGALLLVAGVVALAAVLWQYAGALGQVCLLGALVVGAGAAAVFTSRRIPATGMALSLVAAGCWFTFALLMAHTIEEAFASLAEPEFTVLFAATAGLGLLAGRTWRMPAWSVVGALAIPLAMASALALLVTHSDGARAAALSAGLLGALGILGLGRPQVHDLPHRVPVVVVTLCLAPVFLVASLGQSHEPANVMLVAAVLAGLGVLSETAPATRLVGTALLGVAAGASVGFGFGAAWPSMALVLACAVAGLLLTPWRRVVGPLTALAAAVVWMVFAGGAYESLSRDVGWTYAALLAGLGVTTAVWASRIRRLLALALSCVLSSAAVLLAVALIADSASRDATLEWYTVPLAIASGGYGYLASRLRPGLSSIVTLGPSVGVLLVPAAVLGVSEDGTIRVYVVMAVAVGVVVAGILLRLWGLLAPAAVALVIVALEPLGMLASSLPSWVSYSAAGLILLVIGARFEHVRTRARRAGRWAGEHLR